MSTAIMAGAVIAALLLLALWAIQLRTRDAATADLGWALVIAGGAVLLAVISPGDALRRAIVGAMAFLWAMRLAVYLFRDRIYKAKEEDGRYRALRNHWGARAPLGFLAVYLGQGFVAALFLLPIGAAMRGGELDAWGFLGILIWCVAVIGESSADRQLASFRKNPANRGEVCRAGWWKYSRHPNYFFEWLHWWSYVSLAHAALFSWVGPVMMLVFLFRITGIPWTELQAAKSRGAKYRAYQRTTSVFVPWWPASDAS